MGRKAHSAAERHRQSGLSEFTNDPVIGGGYTGYASGQLGNYHDFAVQGAINLPSATPWRRASHSTANLATVSTMSPVQTAVPTRVIRVICAEASGRFGLLWKPDDALSVLLKIDYNYLDFGAYPADPYYATEDLFNIGVNSPQQALDRFGRVALKIDYALPDGITLRSVTGYQKGNTSYQADLDGTNGLINVGGLNIPLPNDYFADTVDETLWSEEFNVISPDTGFLTWIAGVYFDHDIYNFLPPYQFLIATPLVVPSDPTTEYRLQGTNPNQAWAGFGRLSFQLSSAWQLQIGARYTDAKTTNHVDVLQYGTYISDQQSQKYTNTSGKVSLNWTINPNNFAYAFVSTGFRPGGLNVPVGLGTPAAFDSEKLTTFEVGYKNTAFEGHLRTQLDAFYYNYKNFQVIVGYPQFPTFGFELNNPNPTHITVSKQTQAVFGNLFDAGTAFMHSELGQFYATDPRIPSFTPATPRTAPRALRALT